MERKKSHLLQLSRHTARLTFKPGFPTACLEKLSLRQSLGEAVLRHHGPSLEVLRKDG